jgi:hypothetical protein
LTRDAPAILSFSGLRCLIRDDKLVSDFLNSERTVQGVVWAFLIYARKTFHVGLMKEIKTFPESVIHKQR